MKENRGYRKVVMNTLDERKKNYWHVMPYGSSTNHKFLHHTTFDLLMSYFSVFFLLSTCKGLLDSPGLNIRAKTAGPDTESTKFCGKKRRKHNMRGTEVSAISKKKMPAILC